MTPQEDLHVLVVGATGRQGGALARRLLERGHRVRGMTRDPDKPGARALAQEGAEMVKGFLASAESVEAAAAGTDVAFLLTTPYGPAGPAGETKQGLTAVDALGRAGVQHIVYASVANVDRETGVPHFDGKRAVEERLLEIGVPYTVVAPVYLRENVREPWCLLKDELRLPLPSERPLQTIGVDEVGTFHAYAVEHHADLMGERIDIASDVTTPVQMADAIAAASGRPFRFQRIQYLEMQAIDDKLARMYEWLDRVGFRVDIERVRNEHPDLPWRTFREWAEAQDWSLLQKLPAGAEEAEDAEDEALSAPTEEDGTATPTVEREA